MNLNSEEFIPFARPDLGAAEEEAALRVIRGGWLTTGKENQAFEEEFIAALGNTSRSLEVQANEGGSSDLWALGVNSATAGLHLALAAGGIGPGDFVVMSPYTFVSTAEVVLYRGAKPLFCDVEPGTFHLDVDRVKKLLRHPWLGRKIKAVIPVHISGCSWRIRELAQVCREKGVLCIEDAAHTFPSEAEGKAHGTWGDVGVFSFYANKTITTGEGGMVVTPRQDLAEQIRPMRLHGIDREVWNRYQKNATGAEYDIVTLGYKYNLPDLGAAIGRVQLSRAWELRDARRAIAKIYGEGLGDRDWLQLPFLGDGSNPSDWENENFTNNSHSWHLFILRLVPEKLSISRNEFVAELKERAIGTSLHFLPLHRMSYYRRMKIGGEGPFPEVEGLSDRAISLPLFPSMTEAQVRRVIAEVLKIGDTFSQRHG